MSLGLRVTGVLLAVWLIAAGVVMVVRASKPTPEKIVRYMGSHPLAAANGAARAKIIAEVAERLNHLDFEERRELRGFEEMDGFFDSLTDEERSRFLDLTLPEGFRQMMIALNKMKPERRKEIVERALADLEKGAPERDGDGPPLDDAQVQKIISQGVTSFFEEANADVKLDFAPVIEQIQQSVRWRD